MMKRRQERRVEKCLLVNISRKDLDTMGVTRNISRAGLCIASIHIFPVHGEVMISLAAADQVFDVKGEVIWSMDAEGVHSHTLSSEMGIMLRESTEEYLRYVEQIMAGKTKGAMKQTKRRVTRPAGKKA